MEHISQGGILQRRIGELESRCDDLEGELQSAKTYVAELESLLVDANNVMEAAALDRRQFIWHTDELGQTLKASKEDLRTAGRVRGVESAAGDMPGSDLRQDVRKTGAAAIALAHAEQRADDAEKKLDAISRSAGYRFVDRVNSRLRAWPLVHRIARSTVRMFIGVPDPKSSK